jgi:hypothetical protein
VVAQPRGRPDAVVRLAHEQPRRVRARPATGDNRDRLWQRWVAVDPKVDAYAGLRSTETPVVVLEPADGTAWHRSDGVRSRQNAPWSDCDVVDPAPVQRSRRATWRSRRTITPPTPYRRWQQPREHEGRARQLCRGRDRGGVSSAEGSADDHVVLDVVVPARVRRAMMRPPRDCRRPAPPRGRLHLVP